MKLIPTILCGGAGSRLWPVSRELHPKPFIRLADGQSLLQKAWLRGVVLPDVAETLTVTNRELFFKTENEYREVAAVPGNQDPGKFVSTKLAMDDLAYDVLLEIGIRIQPLPIWEEEWQHPETYSNSSLLRNIEQEGIWL